MPSGWVMKCQPGFGSQQGCRHFISSTNNEEQELQKTMNLRKICQQARDNARFHAVLLGSKSITTPQFHG